MPKKKKSKKLGLKDCIEGLDEIKVRANKQDDFISGLAKAIEDHDRKIKEQDITNAIKGKNGVDKELVAMSKIVDILSEFNVEERSRMAEYIHGRMSDCGAPNWKRLLDKYKWDGPKT